MNRSVIFSAILTWLVCLNISLSSFGQKRQLTFCGYSWQVNDNHPTPDKNNTWKDDTSMQFVDVEGRMHLKLKKIFGVYYCSEVELSSSLGYGEYCFYIQSDVSHLDPRIVFTLGISEHPVSDNIDLKSTYGPIEISFSRWNKPSTNAGWYIVGSVPDDVLGICPPPSDYKSIYCFSPDLPPSNKSTHKFIWSKQLGKTIAVEFSSIQGFSSNPSEKHKLISEKKYISDKVPEYLNEHVRISLWFFGNNQTLTVQAKDEIEVIIKGFRFTPAK